MSIPARLRLVSRRLVKAPLFTSVAVATLALGIGANTAMFSVIRGVLLKPLPFADADRLIGVWHAAPGLGKRERLEEHAADDAENRRIGADPESQCGDGY